MLPVRMHHLYDASRCDRLKNHVENEYDNQDGDTLTKVIRMQKFCYCFERFVFFIKKVDVGKGQLVE